MLVTGGFKGRSDDRSPLARLPWLPLILLGAFAIIARKLARLT